MTDKFWMVFVEGTSQPGKKWEVEADARAEAERLVRRVGKPTYLLESVAVCTPGDVPVKWKAIETPLFYSTAGTNT